MTQYLTERDLAALLGVGVSTVQQWRYRGTGPKALKIAGKLIRYRREDVEAWIASQPADNTQRTV